MAGAAQFKSNFLIFVVASAIVYIYYAISDMDWRNVVAFFLLIAVSLGMSRTVSAVIEHRVGVKLEQGLPTVSWILMGVEESPRGPGWCTSYGINTFKSNGYDAEQTKDALTEDLKNRIQYLQENPGYTADFFEKKVLSMWNEPTFQSIWIQQVKEHPYEYPTAISSLLSEDGTLNRWYQGIFDYVQTWIYFFCLLYIVLCFKSTGVRQLFPAIIMVGGFIFHLFWEAKSQYTVVYFFLLIPYATRGFLSTIQLISNKLDESAGKPFKFKPNFLKRV